MNGYGNAVPALDARSWRSSSSDRMLQRPGAAAVARGGARVPADARSASRATACSERRNGGTQRCAATRSIAGVGMTRFGKHLDTGLKALGAEAVAGRRRRRRASTLGDLEAAYVGNAAAGLVTGQESIRGQVILRSIGVGRIPIVNVENACASGSTALHQACAMVTAGLYDVVLALGVEKLYHADKQKSFAAFSRRGGRRGAAGDHGALQLAPSSAARRGAAAPGEKPLDVHGHLRRGRARAHAALRHDGASSSPRWRPRTRSTAA